jgi:hypothetical protein
MKTKRIISWALVVCIITVAFIAYKTKISSTFLTKTVHPFVSEQDSLTNRPEDQIVAPKEQLLESPDEIRQKYRFLHFSESALQAYENYSRSKGMPLR